MKTTIENITPGNKLVTIGSDQFHVEKQPNGVWSVKFGKGWNDIHANLCEKVGEIKTSIIAWYQNGNLKGSEYSGWKIA